MARCIASSGGSFQPGAVTVLRDGGGIDRGQLPQPLHTIARRREYGCIDERRFNHPFQPILKYVDITGKPEPRAIQGC